MSHTPCGMHWGWGLLLRCCSSSSVRPIQVWWEEEERVRPARILGWCVRSPARRSAPGRLNGSLQLDSSLATLSQYSHLLPEHLRSAPPEITRATRAYFPANSSVVHNLRTCCLTCDAHSRESSLTGGPKKKPPSRQDDWPSASPGTVLGYLLYLGQEGRRPEREEDQKAARKAREEKIERSHLNDTTLWDDELCNEVLLPLSACSLSPVGAVDKR
ncbi:hypothetical protein BX600DRAFT_433362 [Xylariales sp. PMI_506]|nr:hypothetical protein BX600DRAFT_433362 [Xylariales sp. PMI_506]